MRGRGGDDARCRRRRRPVPSLRPAPLPLAARVVIDNPAGKPQRIVDAGLTYRPLVDTAQDGMAWYHSRPADDQARLRAGITPAREKEVLDAWKARGGR